MTSEALSKNLENSADTPRLKLVGVGGYPFGSYSSDKSMRDFPPIFTVEGYDQSVLFGPGKSSDWSYEGPPDSYVIGNSKNKNLWVFKDHEYGFERDGISKFDRDFDGLDRDLIQNPIYIEPGKILVFSGPKYLKDIDVLELEQVKPELILENGYVMSVVERQRYLELKRVHGQKAFEVMTNELISLGYGKTSERFDAAKDIVDLNTFFTDLQRNELQALYDIHTADLEGSVRRIPLHAISLRISARQLLANAVLSYGSYKRNSLPPEEYEKFKDFIRSLEESFEVEDEHPDVQLKNITDLILPRYIHPQR